ncbi:MAG: hypothetical protein AAGB31_15600 [Bdellovibrio sp.]
MAIFIYLTLLSFGPYSYGQSLPTYPAFKTAKNPSNIQEDMTIKNMPPIRSQDGLNICYAEVAATLLQAENCKATNTQCDSLSDKDTFSSIDLTRFMVTSDNAISSIRSSYGGLNFKSGGSAANIVSIMINKVKKGASEECASLDKILSKMHSRNESEEAQTAMWARMEKYYTDAKNCSTCLSNIYATAKDDIDRNLNLRTTNEEVLKAFSEETFEKFLDQLLGTEKCKKISDMVFFEGVDMEVGIFPKSGQSPSLRQLKEKTKEILKLGRPLALENICIDLKTGSKAPNCSDIDAPCLAKSPAAQCDKDLRHSVAIAGYRKVCKQPNDCKELFKVVNSWGKSWQEQNNDGWVEANNLLEHVSMEPGVLSWIQDKN